MGIYGLTYSLYHPEGLKKQNKKKKEGEKKKNENDNNDEYIFMNILCLFNE